jgi:hypothetical protein
MDLFAQHDQWNFLEPIAKMLNAYKNIFPNINSYHTISQVTEVQFFSSFLFPASRITTP